jgi:hypothetical protein
VGASPAAWTECCPRLNDSRGLPFRATLMDVAEWPSGGGRRPGRRRCADDRDRGDTSRCHPSPTTGHTGPYHGGSTGLSLGGDVESGKTERRRQLRQDQHPLVANHGRQLRRGDHRRGTHLHRSAHKNTSVAISPRAPRPAWRIPHRPIMRRVSAVAASAGVFIKRRLVGMITKIV